MYYIYSSLLFLGIFGIFMIFVWLVKRAVDQVALQIALEPQKSKSYYWSSLGKVTPFYHRSSNADISRYYNSNINEEEQRLMKEIDKTKSENELQIWFEKLKADYKHKNIPKRVYLRVSTILNGYVWFNEQEYAHRVQAGLPVYKVTRRAYNLERKLEGVPPTESKIKNKDL